jgi:hypothetical protein
LSLGQILFYNGLDDAGKKVFLDILRKEREGAREAREEGREEGKKEERKRGVCLLHIYYRDFSMLCMLC